jgi:hypothetical protein
MVIIASFRAAGVSVADANRLPPVGAAFDSLDLLARKALSDLPDGAGSAPDAATVVARTD